MQAWIAVVILFVLVLALMFSRRRQPLPALREAALAEDALCMHVKTKAAGYDARGFTRMPSIHRAVRDLREAYRYCASLQNTLTLTPASQWLCDNVRMLEEAAVSVNDALRRGPRLPSSEGITQVTALAREIIAHSDARVDKHLLTACACAWQQAQPLTEAELWALPLALRRGLVLLAAEIARDCVHAERARVRAQHWAARMSTLNGHMPAAFKREAQDTAFLERLLTLLLENEDSAGLSWLDARLQQLDTTAERVAGNEHMRQTRARDWMGNAVISLRRLAAMDWQASLEELSSSDAWLRKDPAEIYEKMDFSSRCLYRTRAARIARVCKVPEAVVARRAISCAAQGTDTLTRHVGYYLIDEGLPKLWAALGGAPKHARLWRLLTQRASLLYMGCIVFFDAVITIGLAVCGLPWWVLAVAIVPIGEGVRQLLSLAITNLAPPRRLPRIAPEHIKDRTLVVVPTLLTSRAHALEMVRHLSVLRFANPEGMIDYMLLADFADSPEAEKPEDAALTEAALNAVEALNQVWGGGYYYLHRKRVWDEGMGRHMGPERKRGALEALNEWIVDGFSDTQWAAASFDPRLLHGRYRHVVTLDADTRLPPDSALALAGALAHPLNAPCEHQGKRRGHAVIQPRMEVAAGTVRTHLGRLYGGDGGVDLYVTAYAELYQNLAAAGSFAGKGVYDPVAFHRAIQGRIRKGTVLSHDLLEGTLARASLACDITLYDGQPATLLGWMKRQHRWTRGDWQLLPWLFPWVRGDRGKFRNPLDGLSKFKIYENLRRSLLPPVCLLLLLGGFLTGSLSALLLALIPAQLGAFLPPSRRSLTVLLIRLALIPYESAIQLDAIGRTLWRVCVSHRRMLEWVTSAESDKQAAPSSKRRFWPMLPAGLLALTGSVFHPWFLLAALPLSAAWLAAPRLSDWLDSPAWPDEQLDESQHDMLRELARETWHFFEANVNARTHYLPPDNVQVEPARGVAPRTSPTNIGMYLLSCSAAYRLNLIGAQEMCERISATLSTVERMETWRGHLLNWYDVRTLKPLPPRYVSSVDSGNMAVCLIAVAQAVRGVLGEVSPELHSLPARLETLVDRICFQALYDESVSLFYIGLDVESGNLGDAHYDLLASESRMLSYLAIMRREVPLKHWRMLGRTMTATHAGATLLSWGGTAFEYLMPLLLLRHVPGTLLGISCRHATLTQIQAAGERPWGVSESGFWAFDPELSYQYRAFGLPQLSLRSGAPQPVIAPYASALALRVTPRAAAQNLARMRQMGWSDEQGMYEAADYDAERIPKDREYMLVRSHMAHHQGMILCSICNQLCSDTLIRDFHGLPQAEAYTLLLEECLPTRRMLARAVRPRYQPPALTTLHARRVVQPDSLPLQTYLLHGNGTTLMRDANGNGYIAHQGVMLTRWRPDPTLTHNGPQCWIRHGDTLLLAGGSDGELVFESGRALWKKRLNALDLQLDCGVSPLDGAAVFLLTLRNHGPKAVTLEIASFAEIALSAQAADVAHPAFRNLSIEISRPHPQLLVARRRPRSLRSNAPLLAHILSVDGAPEVQADGDRAAFLGREGGLPAALKAPFDAKRGNIGSVVDPCVSLRTCLCVPADGEVRAAFLYAAAETEEEAHELAAHYAHPDAAHRALQLAGTQAEVTARYLNLDAAQQLAAQSLAAYLLYHGQPAGRAEAIEDNRLGVRGLWGMSLSGDLPILTLRVAERSAMPMVRSLLRCHEYLRQLGLWFDLVFLCCHESGYNQPIRDALREAVAASPARDLVGHAGGVHLLDGQTLSSQQRGILLAASALTLHGRDGGLQAQLAALRRAWVPRTPSWPKKPRRYTAPDLPAESLILDNGFGGFDADAAYVLHPGKTPPAPWSNVLANPHFGMIVTERGAGFTWAGNSNLRRLTPFLNDPVRDRIGETLYLRDEETGQFWTPTPAPCGSGAPIRVRHGQGYSLFETNGMGLTQRLTLFADPEHPLSCRMLTLENHGDSTRRLSMTAYVQWSFHSAGENRLLCHGESGGIVWVQHPVESGVAYVAIPGHAVTYTTDALSFLGNGGPERPRGMLERELDHLGGESPCAALRCTFTIEPGERKTLCMVLGQATDVEEAAAHRRLYEQPEDRLHAVRALWDQRLGRIRVRTPDAGLNLLLERWLPYQTTTSRLWARAGFYQAGGAIGFRDQLQDMLVLLYTHPQDVRAHILEAAAHQFEDGDVQHWWHPPTLGVRTRISDDKLFLPFVTAHYVAATGDTQILEAPCPYLRNHPIPAGSEDWFGEATPTDYSAPLLEHCLRAMEHVALGPHGLPLIGTGDWNDAMSHIGPDGKGESVWLGFFYIATLRAFASLCPEEQRQTLLDRAQTLLESAERHAWDGAWYRRAWFDDGQVIGSAQSPECKIDCIAQSWSVLAQAAPERTEQAMRSVLEHLVDEELGIIKLLSPPFDGALFPGYIRGYLPGVRENGGQYTHGAIWSVLACLRLGWKEEAWALFRRMLPLWHSRNETEALRYRVEPYVAAADIYANPQQAGRGGWTWYTGAAAWLAHVGIQGLLGMEKRGERVRLRPTAPKDWTDGYEIDYQWGNTLYRLCATPGLAQPLLDGQPLTGGWVHLTDDGSEHVAQFPLTGD